MSIRRNQKQNFLDSKIIPFIKKYGIFIIGLFVVFPYAYKYYKLMIESVNNSKMQAEQTANTNENAKADPQITKKKTEEVAKKYPKIDTKTMATLVASARGIASAFGTNVEDNHIIFGGTVELFNVNAWNEDETEAMRLLKKHTGTFPVLEELYYKTATRSRNLISDILKYLSDAQIQKMRTYYKSKGYTWF
ncbi:hypothetical protein [Flavobacterium marginilacus]|uniref:hypothetical protein n=1 Tax=Flavobacterium marginilacus TaxID=3003256 RepID=UPI00248DCE8D|nr:hypothetical protein [Flavobacterium marginilacus]